MVRGITSKGSAEEATVVSSPSFHCRNISKKVAHNIIRDMWATELQPALATTEYIHQNYKVDIECKP
jgi:hypothetical protein